MLRELMADNKHMAAAVRKAHKLADDHGDSGTAGLLDSSFMGSLFGFFDHHRCAERQRRNDQHHQNLMQRYQQRVIARDLAHARFPLAVNRVRPATMTVVVD
jgi:hypothetical protein